MPLDNAGNDFATSKQININPLTTDIQKFNDWVGSDDLKDIYSFKLSGRSNVNLNLESLQDNADFRLLDSVGGEIGKSVNKGTTLDSIKNKVLDRGTYYIEVIPYSNTTNTYYNLQVSTALQNNTAGNTLTTAKSLTLDATQKSFYDWAGVGQTLDFYSVQADIGSELNLQLKGLKENADIQLLDNLGNILQKSANAGTTTENIKYTFQKAANYYLKVESAAGANTDYELSALLKAPLTTIVIPQDTDGASLTTATNISFQTPTITINNSVGASPDTQDYYSFSLNEARNFQLNLSGLTSDVNVELLDANTNILKSSANTGVTAESIATQLNPGKFFVRVYSSTGVNSNYGLNLSATIVNPDAGDTILTAKDININNSSFSTSETVSGIDTNDYYRFTLNDSSNFSVKLEGLTGDANLHLLNSAGQTIGKSETGGTASESISTKLLKGTYYLRAFPNNSNTIKYTLTSSASALPADTDGTLVQAKQITVDSTQRSYQDSVGTFDTNDYYKFNLTSLSNVNIGLGGLSSDANLYLLDSSGNVLKRSENGGTTAENITQQLGAGTYHIRVFPNSNASTINYTLSTQTSAPVVDSDGTTATARNLVVNSTKQTISDSIGGTDANDYYKFSLTNAAQLNLTVDGLTADANVQLLDSNASVIQTSANTGNTAETISRQLNSGTYYLRVYPNGSTSSNYNLNIATAATSSTTPNTTPNLTTIANDPDGRLEVARNITLNSTQQVWSDSVGPTDLHDYYRFNLKDKSVFQLSLFDLTSDAHVELLNSNGKILQGSYIGGRVTETIASKLDVGDYFIRVFANSGVNINYKLGAQVTAFTPSINNNETWFTNTIKDLGIKNLATSLAADGSFSRNDIISILREAKDNGEVNADELIDLKAIINIDNNLVETQGYIRNLASKVIGSSPANQKYQGGLLGDLKAGSSDVQMEKLINKWFFGGDRPQTLNSTHVYSAVSGSLFQNGVSYLDIKQGAVGDCYLMVALTSIAHKKPEYIESMFTDNGDNTYTVRFYNYGVADYVTVDNYLPTKDGKLVYGNAGNLATNSSNELWGALAEKAYAQLNELDWIWRDGTNTYQGIEAGRMYEPIEQITGRTASIEYASDLTQQKLIDLTNSPQLTTAAFVYGGGYGVVDGHAYTIISYDPTQGTFYLHNPWGTNHANVNWQQLSQLQAEFEITYA
jgi:Calpain family cysteine protease/Bacterial pre-peptidase C-terminal domain